MPGSGQTKAAADTPDALSRVSVVCFWRLLSSSAAARAGVPYCVRFYDVLVLYTVVKNKRVVNDDGTQQGSREAAKKKSTVRRGSYMVSGATPPVIPHPPILSLFMYLFCCYFRLPVCGGQEQAPCPHGSHRLHLAGPRAGSLLESFHIMRAGGEGRSRTPTSSPSASQAPRQWSRLSFRVSLRARTFKLLCLTHNEVLD